MSRWTLGAVAHCLTPSSTRPEDLATDQRIDGICTDTRTLRPGSLFVPLVGESFDGHDYAEKAVDMGAAAVVWARPEVPDWLSETRLPVFKVEDTTDAYQALGLYHRKACGVRCIAITGSVGKTTTKEFLAHLLEGQFKVHKSSKNFNNDIGVPLTLLELDESHDLVIVEMGMRGAGQIARLVRASEPEVGLITGIGTSHMELLGSRQAIAEAKGELAAGLPATGRAVLPASDEFFPLLESLATAPVLSYAAHGEADIAPERILHEDQNGTTFLFTMGGKEHHLGQPGRHHLHDLMGALAAGQAIGADMETMLERLPSLTNPEGRAEWRDLDGVRIFLDAYNSAPESLRAALGVIASAPGRKVAVLGDMLELGAASIPAHEEIGKQLADFGVTLAFCVGPLSHHTVEQAVLAGVDAHWYSSKEELALHLRRELREGDTVLVKASRGLALETVVSSLQESAITS